MNWLRSVFRQYNALVSLRQLAIPNGERGGIWGQGIWGQSKNSP